MISILKQIFLADCMHFPSYFEYCRFLPAYVQDTRGTIRKYGVNLKCNGRIDQLHPELVMNADKKNLERFTNLRVILRGMLIFTVSFQF